MGHGLSEHRPDVRTTAVYTFVADDLEAEP